MQETWEMRVRSLGQDDPLEEGMAAHSSILAWRIPWTEGSGGLESIESQRVGHEWSNLVFTYFKMKILPSDHSFSFSLDAKSYLWFKKKKVRNEKSTVFPLNFAPKFLFMESFEELFLVSLRDVFVTIVNPPNTTMELLLLMSHDTSWDWKI